MRGDGARGCATASELEPEQLLASFLGFRWRELPFPGSTLGQAREIRAGSGVLQDCVGDIARGVDDHEHRHLDVAMNRLAGAVRDAGKLFMNDGT